jgi:uncharacterized protein
VRRRTISFAVAAWLVSPRLAAQTNWRQVAVPAYTPPAFVDGVLKFWYVPRAQAFAGAADGLVESLRTGCGPAAQSAWRKTLQAWVLLGTVAIGPLVERRSARRIDFSPTRPELIRRAITTAPDGEAAMERIGSAAKGLPALEWLLWSASTPEACRYALQVALDINREAQALRQAFIALRDREIDDAAVVATMSEAVNQWIGGLEQLRLQGIERPLHDARSRGLAKPRFARDLSGTSALERESRWQALRALAVFDAPTAPAAGEGLVPLETYLRGKGLNPLADRLRASALQAGGGLGTTAPARLQDSARRLAALKTLAETEVAPALDVRLGFSDADGD